jgi:predicted nucleotidyltransferase
MELEQSISAVRRALEGDERISAALLFGSAARGSARAASDLDVALVARSPEDAEALRAERFGMMGRLAIAARRDVQVLLLEDVGPVLRRQVFLDARPLFDRCPTRTKALLEHTLLEYFDGEYHRRMLDEALDRQLGVTGG